MKKNAIISMFCIVLWGCTLAEVKVDVVSERTVLENQILGTYNSLDREMLLLASVRGVDSQGQIRQPPQHSRDHQDALTAMQIQEFHADDIQAFKRLGWVGENKEGLLTGFPMHRADIPEDMKAFSERFSQDEFDSIVTQVNQAREVIMRRVLDLNETLTDADIVNIRRIFGKLNSENALPGEKIQTENGDWITKAHGRNRLP